MSSDKSDKYIKETLQDYESPVDVEALWQAVQPPRRRRAIWWWVSGMLLVLVSVGGWLWWSSSQVNSPALVGLEGEPEKISSANDVINSDTKLIDSSEDSKYSTRTEQTSQREQGPQKTTQHSKTLAETTNLNEEPRKNLSKNEDTLNQESDTKAGAIASSPNDLVIETSFSAKRDASQIAESPITEGGLPAGITNTTSFEPAALPTVPGQQNATENEWSDEDQTDISARQRLDEELERLPTLAIQLFSPVVEELTAELPLSPSAPQVKRKRSPWSAQWSGGAYRLSRSFTMNDSLDNREYLDFRRQTEQPLEALSADLSLIYEHPSQFRFRTGLGWTSIHTVFETSQMSSRVDSVLGVQSIYLSPEGDTTFQEGLIAAYRTIQYRKKHYNRIQHWDVPLLIGYQWSVGSWQLLVEGGVRFNLSQQVSGEVLDRELNRIDLSASDRFQTRVGLSYQGGVGVGYAISPRLSIRANMNLRYFPKDFTQASASIGERYQLLGGQLGVQYRF